MTLLYIEPHIWYAYKLNIPHEETVTVNYLSVGDEEIEIGKNDYKVSGWANSPHIYIDFTPKISIDVTHLMDTDKLLTVDIEYTLDDGSESKNLIIYQRQHIMFMAISPEYLKPKLINKDATEVAYTTRLCTAPSMGKEGEEHLRRNCGYEYGESEAKTNEKSEWIKRVGGNAVLNYAFDPTKNLWFNEFLCAAKVEIRSD
jgi:hypothetical protein